MKLGIPVWYGDIRRLGLERAISRVSHLGFDYFELSLDYPIHIFKKTESIHTNAQRFGLGYAFHAPWAGMDIASPISEIRNASLEVMRESIESISGLEPYYYNAHILNHIPTYRFEEIKRKSDKYALYALNRLKRLGKKHKINIIIENNPCLFMGLPEHFNKIEKICLDIGHAVIVRWIQKKDYNVDEWFKMHKNRIEAIHFHDCILTGRPIDHLVLGEGQLDIERLVTIIKNSNCRYVLLETVAKVDRSAPTESDFKKEQRFCRRLFGPVV
ncbi:MAG: sugar phosphate isomerase/epimerase [Candidatus Aenigmatarchaeota archaeon]